MQKKSFVKHNFKTNPNFNFKDSKMLLYVHNKQHKKIVESRIISNYNDIKQKPGILTYLHI